MAKISCITTTHNEGPLLLNAVRSVLGQSFCDFEYLIVDDGSSKETLEILSQLDDPRLTVILQSHGGLSAARNTGISRAKGDYICFLDADDLRPNWSFAAIAQTIEATDADLVLCPGMVCDLRDQIDDFYDAPVFAEIAAVLPQGVSTRQDSLHGHICTLAQQIEPQVANKVVRRSFLQAIGLRFPEPYFFEDIFFHTLAIAQADRIAFLDQPAFSYFHRYQRPQITANTGAFRFDIIAVVRQTLDAFALLPVFHDLAYRGVVFASCIKLIDWCAISLAHPLRAAFRRKVNDMMGRIDQGFLEGHQDSALGSAFQAAKNHCHALEKTERISDKDLQLQPPDVSDVTDGRDGRITLRAFGQRLSIYAPDVDFLRADSLWRLRHIYQPALSTQSLAQEGIALDIGAGFGVFALPFALAYPGWRIFCFEPDPVAFAYLQRNIQDLALSQITALPFAVGHQKDDGLQDDHVVRSALSLLLSGQPVEIAALTQLLPLRAHSMAKMHKGYLERGHCDQERFDPVQMPTLPAALLESLSPRLIKLIAPQVEAKILSDLSHAKLDHLIGESWSHIPSELIHSPHLGKRQTWMPRAGQAKLGLIKAADTGGYASRLDIIVALCDPQRDLACLTALLSDPSRDIRVIAVTCGPAQQNAALVALAHTDPRLNFVCSPNDGQAFAWNFGRRQSNATHLAFVDGRSFAENGFFSALFDLARQTGAEVVQGPYHLINSVDPATITLALPPQIPDPIQRFVFAQTTYHRLNARSLIPQFPSIWRRTYRQDFLDRRDIWFSEDHDSISAFVFQTLTLQSLSDVPELDGIRLGYQADITNPIEQAHWALSWFDTVLNRASSEGWLDVNAILQIFAAQVSAISANLPPTEKSRFILSATALSTQAQKIHEASVLQAAPFDQG